MADSPEELDVLARRVDVIEELTAGPLHKADLVERLPHSRSTINRAVSELEEAGYAERVTEGYVATQAGQLAARRYREYVAAQRSVLTARPVLAAIPYDNDLPPELLADARVATEDPGYRLLELLADRLDRADEVRLALPALPDSRYLRLCHSRVLESTCEVLLQAPAEVLGDIAGEFPEVWADLEAASGFRARGGETPPFGLVVAAADGEPTAATVVAVDEGAVAGFIDADHPTATTWAAEVIETLEADAERVPSAPTDGEPEVTPLTGDRLPGALRREGFVRLDDRYLDRHEPMAPATAWRVGLGLPEVAAGYAVERYGTATTDGATGGGTALSDRLLASLRDGDDVALVGPPGSGKSTVCKAVAHRWFADDNGAVLYREAGRGEVFESTAALETALDRATDPVLVVVEHAVRSSANAVFEVMRAFGGREDVVFLLDARESEWRNPESFPVDARLRAFRREAVEAVPMPALSVADCRRAVDRMAAVTGETVDVDVESLLADLEGTGGDATAGPDGRDGAAPGLVSLLFHRLTRYLDPMAPDAETSLDEDVDRVRENLATVGEAALDAGVLVNLLNAAGVAVAPEFVHAVGVSADDHDAVRTAIDRLEGQVLFSAEEAGHAYRTVHDDWSARFLARLLEAAGPAVANRVGRCVTALLSLADGADRRAAVARESGGTTRALDRIVADPTAWADDTVAAVFAVGRTYPKLAPLFGADHGAGLTLPAACSPEVAARTDEWRGRMFAAAGDLDRAARAFERLDDAAADLPEEAADAVRLERLLGLADVARQRGDTGRAADRAREALSLAERVDRPEWQARAQLALGGVACDRGDLEAAEDYLAACLDAFEEVPGRRAATRRELGAVALARGDYEAAAEQFERARETWRSVGDRRGEATALGELGEVANRRGDHESARRNFMRALEAARLLGDRGMEASYLKRLGDTARQQGAFERAETHAREALAAFEAVGDRHGVAKVRRDLGTIAGRQDRLDRAREQFEAALDAFEAVGDRHGVARVHYNLGTVAGKRDEFSRARERFERALEEFRAVGNSHAIAGVHNNLGMVARESGDLEAADEWFEEALAGYEDVGDRQGVARTRLNLGTVARRRGAYEAALEHLVAGRETLESVGDDHRLAMADRNRGLVALARDDFATAREQLSAARERNETVDARQGIARVRSNLGRLARKTGDFEAAKTHLAAAREGFQAADSPKEVARVDLERARLALAREDPDRTTHLAASARETLADLGASRGAAIARGLEARAGPLDIERFEAAVEELASMEAYPDALAALESFVERLRADGDHEVARRWLDRAADVAAAAPDAAADAHAGWIDRHRSELQAG